MIDDTTAHLALPLPNSENDLADDVGRLRTALSLLDTAVAAKADAATISAAISDLIGAAPGALNTLQELAAAIANDPTFAADIAAQLVGLNTTVSALSNTVTSQNAALAARVRKIEIERDIGGF